MNITSIYHRPLSEYAFAVDDNNYIFRLRTGKGELTNVCFYFADRASMEPELSYEKVNMPLSRQDKYYDWYEVKVQTQFERVAYYFELLSEKERLYYYGDCFSENSDMERFEPFQLPYNHRADRIDIPDWVKDAVVYNIFPDSFASGKRYISKEASECNYNEICVKSNLGGTINGISENLDYIRELGFNVIYLNPFFVADSYHKYDLIDYFQVDPTRGSNDDFKRMVEKAHSLGMKVIIDGVFNHTSSNHPFFIDVKEKGKKSPYYDYYYELNGGNGAMPKPGDKPEYTCFAYVPQMPKTDTSNKELCQYFCSVGEYWIKEYDADGWRLDVANELNDEFLRNFRNTVKKAKADAIVIGEVWENAAYYINGKMMDGAMNYDFRRFATHFFASNAIDAKEFDVRVSNMLYRYPKQSVFSQLNLLDSHDVSRFLTVCGDDRDKMELAILFQMTFVGMPSVFYGDEAGINGKSEPEYRKAMVFDIDDPLYDIYRKFISLRNQYEVLRRGEFHTVCADGNLYAYSRISEDTNQSITVYMNVGKETIDIKEPNGDILYSKNYEYGILNANGYIVLLTPNGRL